MSIRAKVIGFIVSILLLLLAGIVFIFDASYAEAYRVFGNQYHFVRNQAIWAVLGIVAMVVAAATPVKLLQKSALGIGVGILVLLFLVFIPNIGQEVNGARRWISISGYQFQPSEFAKLGLVLFGGYLLTVKKGMKYFFGFFGVAMLLILLQPDLDTVIVIGTTMIAMLFVAGITWRSLASMGIIAILTVPALIMVSPYRRARVMTYLDASADPLGSSYHVRQVQLALGSGGLFGQGFGQSRAKYQFIPEASTDSIFAIVAEEVGFFGSAIVLLFLSLPGLLGYGIARAASSMSDKIIATGITTWLMTQTLLNLGAMTMIIPLSGIPLPFLSYGGSSLLSVLLASGILVGIGIRAGRS